MKPGFQDARVPRNLLMVARDARALRVLGPLRLQHRGDLFNYRNHLRTDLSLLYREEQRCYGTDTVKRDLFQGSSTPFALSGPQQINPYKPFTVLTLLDR